MDESVKIPIELDSSLVLAQLAQINETLKQGFGKIGADAAVAATAGFKNATPEIAKFGSTASTAAVGAGVLGNRVGSLAAGLPALSGAFQGGASGLMGFAQAAVRVGAGLGPLVGIVAGVGLAFAGIKKSVQDAAEAADTVKLLNDAITRTGATASTVGPQIEDAIQRMFDVSAFDDEPLRRAATTFVTITGNAQLAAKAIAPIADLAAAMGRDVESAALTVAKAAEGSYTALQRVGIIFDEQEKKALKAADANERYALIFDKISQKVGGAAASQLGTYAGQVENLSKQWGELSETLGTAFLPTVIDVLKGLSDLAKSITAVADAVKTVELGPFFADMQLLQKLLERGKMERPADANLRALLPGGEMIPEPKAPPSAVKDGYDEIGEAIAKANAEALKFQHQAEDLHESLGEMVLKIETEFEPPETDQVAIAVKAVDDQIREQLDSITAKTKEVTRSMADEAAQIATLQQAIAKARADAAAEEDPAKQKALQVQVYEYEQTIAAVRRYQDEERAALDLLRQLPAEVIKFGEAKRAVTRENEFKKMADEARAAFQALKDEVAQIAAEAQAELSGLALPPEMLAGLRQSIEQEQQRTSRQLVENSYFPPEQQKALDDAAIKTQAAHTKGISDGAKIMERTLAESAEDLAAAVEEASGQLADVFVAGLTGGAEGFADAASRLFLSNLREGAQTVFASAIKSAFGAAPEPGDFKMDTEEGRQQYVDAQKAASVQNAAIAQAVTSAVGAIGETMRIFQQAKQGQAPSILGTTVSFAVTGASIGSSFPGLGTVIGAAVGAIVGAIIGILAAAKARAEQVFATYGVRDGQPYVEPAPDKWRQFANLPESTYQEMLDTIQQTWESTTNDYVKLMGRFGKGIADGVSAEITKANFAPQLEASKANIKNFMADFQYWVENTLPADIGGKFKAPIMEGFQALGLTAEKFNEIWQRLLAIDPSAAIETLNELIDVLNIFRELQLDLDPNQYGITVGLFTQAREDMTKAFVDQLAEMDFNLVQMGDTMSQLVGPEQISAAKEWGDALLSRQQAMKDFFQQLALAIDSVIQGYQGKIRDLTLAGFKTEEGAPDVGAQVDYLKKYADTLWGQITRATTPEEVLRLSEELSATISKIQQIGGAQSVEAAEAYRVWAIEQLQRSQELVVGQLNKMAQDVAEQNAAFLDAIQGFIDAFLMATDQLTGDTTSGGDIGRPTGHTPTREEQEAIDEYYRNPPRPRHSGKIFPSGDPGASDPGAYDDGSGHFTDSWFGGGIENQPVPYMMAPPVQPPPIAPLAVEAPPPPPPITQVTVEIPPVPPTVVEAAPLPEPPAPINYADVMRPVIEAINSPEAFDRVIRLWENMDQGGSVPDAEEFRRFFDSVLQRPEVVAERPEPIIERIPQLERVIERELFDTTERERVVERDSVERITDRVPSTEAPAWLGEVIRAIPVIQPPEPVGPVDQRPEIAQPTESPGSATRPWEQVSRDTRDAIDRMVDRSQQPIRIWDNMVSKPGLPEEGGGVPEKVAYRDFISGLERSSAFSDRWSSNLREVEAARIESAGVEREAHIQNIARFERAVAAFEAVVASGLSGGLDVTINEQPAGTVQLEPDSGFDRRVVSSRGRRAT